MKTSEAVALVVEDARQGFSPSEMTDVALIEYTYNTVGVNDVQGDDNLAMAYSIVLNVMDYSVGSLRLSSRASAELLLIS